MGGARSPGARVCVHWHRGQSIFVDPQSRLVMVHTAVRKQAAAGSGPRESTALWAAAVRELGGSR